MGNIARQSGDTVHSGKYDKSIIRDVFDVLVKNGLSYDEAIQVLCRSARLVIEQQDATKVRPLELELKAVAN